MSGTSRPSVSRLGLCLLFAASLAIGLWVRRSYLDAFPFNDDLLFFRQIGLLKTGRLGWIEYLFTPQGPHLMVLWKWLFYLEWEAFGLSRAPWRIAIGLVHSASAVALFCVLRRYLASTLGASAAAFMWAGAACGGSDSPLLWQMCGNIALAVLALLGAMLCVACATERPHVGYLVGFVLAALTTVCVWSSAVFALPGVLLQLVLSSRSLRPKLRWWIVAWTGSLLLGLSFEVPAVLLGGGDRSSTSSPMRCLLGAGSILSTSLAGLTFERVPDLDWLRRVDGWVPDKLLPDRSFHARFTELWSEHNRRGWAGTHLTLHGTGPAVGWLAIVLGLCICFVRGWKQIQILAVLFTCCVPLLLVTSYGGSARSISESSQYGRYLYLPTLAWCATAGVLVDGVIVRQQSGRVIRGNKSRAICVFALGVYALFLLHQEYVADYTRDVRDWISTGAWERFCVQQRLLEGLARENAARVEPLDIVDFPVDVHMPGQHFWPASAFAAVAARQTLPTLRFVPATEATDEQLRDSCRALAALKTSSAAEMASDLPPYVTQVKLFAWLEQFARDQGLLVRLPPLQIVLPNRVLSINEALRWGAGLSPDHLVFESSAGSPSSVEVRELIERLERNTAPAAREWASFFRRLPGIP